MTQVLPALSGARGKTGPAPLVEVFDSRRISTGCRRHQCIICLGDIGATQVAFTTQKSIVAPVLSEILNAVAWRPKEHKINKKAAPVPRAPRTRQRLTICTKGTNR